MRLEYQSCSVELGLHCGIRFQFVIKRWPPAITSLVVASDCEAICVLCDHYCSTRVAGEWVQILLIPELVRTLIMPCNYERMLLKKFVIYCVIESIDLS